MKSFIRAWLNLITALTIALLVLTMVLSYRLSEYQDKSEKEKAILRNTINAIAQKLLETGQAKQMHFERTVYNPHGLPI